MGIFLNTTSKGLLPHSNEVLTGPHTLLDHINGQSLQMCTGLCGGKDSCSHFQAATPLSKFRYFLQAI